MNTLRVAEALERDRTVYRHGHAVYAIHSPRLIDKLHQPERASQGSNGVGVGNLPAKQAAEHRLQHVIDVISQPVAIVSFADYIRSKLILHTSATRSTKCHIRRTAGRFSRVTSHWSTCCKLPKIRQARGLSVFAYCWCKSPGRTVVFSAAIIPSTCCRSSVSSSCVKRR